MALWVSERPVSTGATAIYPSSRGDDLARRFESVSRFGEPVVLWSIVGDELHLPRAVCPIGVRDLRSDGVAIEIASSIVPRNDEQTRVMSEMRARACAGESFLVKSPTGTGKTVYGIDTICALRRTALVVVTKEDLFDQWQDELRLHAGLRKDEIGRVRGPLCQFAGRKVVVAMIQTLAAGAEDGRFPPELRDYFGLVIWDEAHRVAAETFLRSASLFSARVRLGMTATPERIDGKEFAYEAHIGQVAVVGVDLPMVPIVGKYLSGWQIPRDKKGKRMRHMPGKTGHLDRMLAGNMERNLGIVRLLVKAYTENRRTVVFSSRTKHLVTLKQLLADEKVYDVAYYADKLCTKAQLEAAKTARIMLATYSMMGEGTNIPWLDCCLLATPIANVAQKVGRVLREFPDKPQPVVLDIVDADSWVFRKYSGKRQAYYDSVGAEVRFYREGGETVAKKARARKETTYTPGTGRSRAARVTRENGEVKAEVLKDEQVDVPQVTVPTRQEVAAAVPSAPAAASVNGKDEPPQLVGFSVSLERKVSFNDYSSVGCFVNLTLPPTVPVENIDTEFEAAWGWVKERMGKLIEEVGGGSPHQG